MLHKYLLNLLKNIYENNNRRKTIYKYSLISELVQKSPRFGGIDELVQIYPPIDYQLNIRAIFTKTYRSFYITVTDSFSHPRTPSPPGKEAFYLLPHPRFSSLFFCSNRCFLRTSYFLQKYKSPLQVVRLESRSQYPIPVPIMSISESR